jgi:hypothetical protein
MRTAAKANVMKKTGLFKISRYRILLIIVKRVEIYFILNVLAP